MGQPGCGDISRTHSLFVDDLKQYQENHEALKDVNEIIVQASPDTVHATESQSVLKLYSSVARW